MLYVFYHNLLITGTEELVFELIRSRSTTNQHFFVGKNFNNAEGWRLIARDLKSSFDAPQVKKKWENLIQQYKKLKSPDTGVSSEDGCDLPTTWPFFDAIDNIFANKHVIKPPVLIASLKPSKKNHDRNDVVQVQPINVDSSGSSKLMVKESLQSSNRPSSSHVNIHNQSGPTPTAIEYFGPDANLDFLSPPSKKRKVSVKDNMLDYLKKRDKKLMKQNQTMIFLMKQSLIHEGVDVNRPINISDDSNSDDD